ncbi:hypothetical protein RHECNPAF_7500118 [Rhizobium etli CNPAF512]|nr:hypothetical protein RHECNPAF_7500118 [Rhizobium etli CNPAF512]
MVVSVLGEKTALLQRMAILACPAGFGLQLDGHHQAATAHIADDVRAHRLQAFEEIVAHRGGVFDHALFRQHLQRGARHGAGEWVAAEGRAVLAGFQHPQHLGIRKYRRYRIEAAGERLADQRHIGLDAFMFLGQQLAGAAEAGLDFVENEGDVVCRAELADAGEITGRRNDDACFPLDRLDQRRHGIDVDGGGESLGIAEWNDAEARRVGAEAGAGVGIGGEADDAQRPPMEIVGADDDLRLALRHTLDLVSPFAHRLDGGLHGFSAGIHRQDLVRAGESGELFIEIGELVVAEGAGGEGEPARLLDHGGEDLRMAMALVDRGIGREAIKITVAVGIPDINTFAARQHNVERLVIVGAEPLFRGDQFFRSGHGAFPSEPCLRRVPSMRRGLDDRKCGGRRDLPSVPPISGRSCHDRRETD